MKQEINLTRGGVFPMVFIRRNDSIQLSHPTQLNVGDVLYDEVYNPKTKQYYRLNHEITEVVDSRPARGNYGKYDTPIWHHLKIKSIQ